MDNWFVYLIVAIFAVGFVYSWYSNKTAVVPAATQEVVAEKNSSIGDFAALNQKTAIVAGGCFWCVEADFDKLDGVISTVSGYTGDVDKLNPTYRDHGNHVEAVKVTYDADKLSYEDVINYYYSTVDYTDAGGSFCDRGHAYIPVIYTANDAEAKIAKDLAPSRSVVPIIPATAFWDAEEYHQDYYLKNPVRYKYYRSGCGRDAKIAMLKQQEAKLNKGAETVKANPNAELNAYGYDISHLTPLQKKVTQHEGTERAFTHPYHKNKKEGIYVDIVGGQALYSSTDKYDSGSGWPSFHKSIGEDGAVLLETPEFFSSAIELKSTEARSHLGHIIFDNPYRADRRRHCINGASIVFIPKEEMEAKGYGKWLSLFPTA